MSALNWLVVIIFIDVVYYINTRKKMHDSTREYLLANRKTKIVALIATLVMTELNTSTLLGFSSMGYVAGDWAIVLASVFLFGLLFYAFVVAKKWKQYNGYTVTTLF